MAPRPESPPMTIPETAPPLRCVLLLLEEPVDADVWSAVVVTVVVASVVSITLVVL
jgi:hypothetical protein